MSRVRTRGNPYLKRLDRLVGIPVVWLLGLRSKRARPNTIRRLGILRTAAIGDTLLLRGALQDARRAFAEADIVLFTGENNAEAGDLIATDLARHVVIPVRRPVAAGRVLRRENLDVLIDTGAWPRLDAALTSLSGARFTVGFRTERQARHRAFDCAVTHSKEVHEHRNFQALFREIGVEATTPPNLEDVAFPPAPAIPRPFVVFHPWSGGYRGALKEWPAERWQALASRIHSFGYSIWITGSAAEKSRSGELTDLLVRSGVRAQSAAGAGSLKTVAAILRASSAVVSVNTGIMHLAAMTGAPTISLDGPTSALRWGPIGPRSLSVASQLPGCGHLYLGFEYDGRRSDCMLGISVGDVERAVLSLVKPISSQPRAAEYKA